MPHSVLEAGDSSFVMRPARGQSRGAADRPKTGAAASPIVVLDSGFGGLTVVRALRALLPAENVVYFGDSARFPYGSKTPTTVTAWVRQIVNYLRGLGPKHVVVACNTATALALPALTAAFPDLSISGVIDPGARAAIEAAGARQYPVIGVLATEATVRSKAYLRAIIRRRHHARVLMQPAPLLAPIIEDGRSDADPLVRLALKQYLTPIMEHDPNVLVLGCTHYPVLKGMIERIIGPKVQVIDSAVQCAHDIARRLQATGLGRNCVRSTRGNGTAAREMPLRRGFLRCIVTDDPERFQRLAPRFLGEPVGLPRCVSIDELYGHKPVTIAKSQLRAAI
jgi:glutamate racemase